MLYRGTNEQLTNALQTIGNRGGQTGAIADAANAEIERLRESHDDMLEVLREVSGDIHLPETQSVSNARDLIGKYNFESEEAKE